MVGVLRHTHSIPPGVRGRSFQDLGGFRGPYKRVSRENKRIGPPMVSRMEDFGFSEAGKRETFTFVAIPFP